MGRQKLNILLLAAFCLMWGCVSHGATGGNTGESLRIELASNPSTGYSWSYITDQPGVIKEVSSQYVPASQGAGLVGAPGKQVFVFAGLKSGQALVTFNYARAWENQPVQTVVYRMDVSDDNGLKIAAEAVQ